MDKFVLAARRPRTPLGSTIVTGDQRPARIGSRAGLGAAALSRKLDITPETVPKVPSGKRDTVVTRSGGIRCCHWTTASMSCNRPCRTWHTRTCNVVFYATGYTPAGSGWRQTETAILQALPHQLFPCRYRRGSRPPELGSVALSSVTEPENLHARALYTRLASWPLLSSCAI